MLSAGAPRMLPVRASQGSRLLCIGNRLPIHPQGQVSLRMSALHPKCMSSLTQPPGLFR